MEGKGGVGDRCLICHTNEPVSSFSRANSVLDKHLEVIWLLRTVLVVPAEMLAKFLEDYPDNLEGWIKICGQCGELLKECKVVYQQLLEVNRRWMECRLKVVGIIKESWEDGRDLEEIEVDIARQSRDFVKKNDYISWRNPWADGDLRAFELANKLRESAVVKEEPEENFEAFEGNSFSPDGGSEDGRDFAEDYDKDEDWKPEVEPSLDSRFIKPGRKRNRKKVPMECHICHKTLSSQSTFCNHLEVVHQIKTRISSKYPFSSYTKKPSQVPLLPGTLFRVKCPVSNCPQTWSGLAPYITHMEKEHISKEKSQVSSLSKVIECTECGKMFRNPEHAEDHLLKHDKTLKRDKICEFCGASFITKRRLLTHKHMKAECRQRQGLKPKENVCTICGKTFSSTNYLNQHIYRSHEKGSNRFHLKNHINQVHTKAKPNFECTKCKKSFSNNLLFKRHTRSNCGTIRNAKPLPDNKFRIKCPVPDCPKTWADPNLEASAYRVHLATEHTSEEKSGLPKCPKFLECLECGKTFRDFDKGRHHLCQHNKSLKKRSHECLSKPQGLSEAGTLTLICDICGKVYATKKSLQRHIGQMHKGKKPIVCDVCGISLAPATSLSCHKERSLQCRRLQGITESEATIICNICGKWYSNRYTLQKHILERHEGIFKETCEHCGKGLESESKLKIHLATVHKIGIESFKGKEYECPMEGCGKIFPSKRMATNHFLGVHKQGEPGFKCEQCGKAFYAPGYLSQHINVVHKGYRWKPKNKKKD